MLFVNINWDVSLKKRDILLQLWTDP